MNSDLINKYNVPGPRYTSYPTVPYWNKIPPTTEQWKDHVTSAFRESNQADGVSIYIHLPYCDSLCTYCGCNTRITVNHEVEEPYIEAVLKEWSMYLEMFGEPAKIKEIHLGGGTPTFFSPENLERLIAGILKGSKIHSSYEFGFEAHPNNTTQQHLEIFRLWGFKRLSLGIQDFDPKVQEIVNRKQSYKQVKLVTEQARQAGFNSINYDLIYGLPLQKRASVEHTIRSVNKLRPDRIAFYSYAHVPWIKPGQRKFTKADLPSSVEKRALYEVGREMLLDAGYYEIGMDHFTLKTDSLYAAVENRTLHRNFMGYTPAYTRLQVGLGASSISDSWTAFAQNAKTIEEYIEKVSDNKIPIVKGHMLDEEDLLLRRHILNLMCLHETSWQHQNGATHRLNEGVERLREMEKDGLVIIDKDRVIVRPRGMPFLRNVCMAFDAKLWSNTPTQQIFSNTI